MFYLMWLLHHHDGETSLTKVENDLPKWLTPICISKPSAVLPYGHTITPALLMRTSSLGSPAGQQNGQVVGSTAPCVGISNGKTFNLGWLLQRTLWWTCCLPGPAACTRYFGCLISPWRLWRLPGLCPCHGRPWWPLPLQSQMQDRG